MDLFLFMEDFDNAELDEVGWEEQMIDAVIDYNEQYDTEHIPMRAIRQYRSWRDKQNQPEE